MNRRSRSESQRRLRNAAWSSAPRTVLGRRRRAGEGEQQVADRSAVEDPVVALVAVAEQAVVAGDLAVLAGVLGALEIRAVGSEVAELERGGAPPARSRP